jgi:hypothetical protein
VPVHIGCSTIAGTTTKGSRGRIGGCFVNLHNPSLEGAEVAVTIAHGKTTFTALGTVVAVVPNMGMDVAFKTIEPTQSAVLQEWLAGLG